MPLSGDKVAAVAAESFCRGTGRMGGLDKRVTIVGRGAFDILSPQRCKRDAADPGWLRVLEIRRRVS
jgi:hypothetical protein